MGKVVLAILLLASLLGVAAWLNPRDERADLVIVNNGDISTLDPAQMSWVQDFRASRCLFEGLTRSDVFSTTFKQVPAAAERWEVSADNRTYTFHLRPDARWSNGEAVVADDFRFAWMRMLMPEFGADYAKLLRLIKGGDEFYALRVSQLASLRAKRADPTVSRDDFDAAAQAMWAKLPSDFDRLVEARAIDDHTLEVHLKKPVPYFLSLTAFPPFFPLHRASVAAYQSIDPRTGQLSTDPAWAKPPHLVSNGPFTLESWRFKRDMRYRKNPLYWNHAAIALDSISMPTIDDGNAAVLAFRAGNVDWLSDVVPAYRADMLAAKQAFRDEHLEQITRLGAQGITDSIEIDRLLPRDERKNISAFPAFGTYFYNFNCRAALADGRPNPLADPRIRRALALAVDKRSLVETIRRCGEPAAFSLIPPGSIAGYQSPRGLGFDVAAARELLAQAGITNPRDFPTVDLLFNKDGGHELIAQFVAKNWEQNLGISVSLAQREVKVFREQVKGGDFFISRGTWFGDYGDPTTFLDINREGDGNNDRGYISPDFEALMTAAEDELDPQARLALLTRAESLIVERDLPLLPLFHYVQIYMFNPEQLTGISPHPRQEQYLYLFDRLGDGKGRDVPLTMHPDHAPRP